jgi:hypothetical protein
MQNYSLPSSCGRGEGVGEIGEITVCALADWPLVVMLLCVHQLHYNKHIFRE